MSLKSLEVDTVPPLVLFGYLVNSGPFKYGAVGCVLLFAESSVLLDTLHFNSSQCN